MSWNDIPGRAAYLWIYDEWLASKPPQGAIVVECGVALGKSLAYLCKRLDDYGRDDVIVYGVDPFIGTHRNGEQQTWADEVGGDFTLYAQTMLKNAPKAFERVRVLRAGSLDVAAWLYYREMDVALVVLDNDHSYSHVKLEIDSWRGGGTWIGGDDFVSDYPGVEQAVREAFGEDFEYRAKGGPLGDPERWPWGTWLHRPPEPKPLTEEEIARCKAGGYIGVAR